MGCLIALFALFSPRFAIVVLWLFTDRTTIAFETGVLPTIGFFFLPWTVLAWTVAYAPVGGVNGFGWFVVIFAFLVDLGSYGSGERARRTRESYA